MNIAFIPVRGGSKSIPLKNIKNLGGKPLVYWTIKAACNCQYIDKVFVSTDSSAIRDVVEDIKNNFGMTNCEKIQVVGRTPESASDNATTEYAMLEFARLYDFDNIVLIQATSPLLRSKDLNGGFELFYTPETDSVLSVVKQYRFLWEFVKDGNVRAINYDIYARPRRQDFSGYIMENGAFYITSKKNLLGSKNRVSGNIKAYIMPEETSVEIDEPSDFIILENLMKMREKDTIIGNKITHNIKMLLTDCDGCLTDGGMYYSEKGDELKKFNTRDGMGFSLLKKQGVLTGILTSEAVQLNYRRAEKLKLDIIRAGCTDKVLEIENICEKYKISPENIAYIGDDINDLGVIKMVGYGCCPSDAVEEVKAAAKYITTAKGGEGVIREVAQKILSELSKN